MTMPGFSDWRQSRALHEKDFVELPSGDGTMTESMMAYC